MDNGESHKSILTSDGFPPKTGRAHAHENTMCTCALETRAVPSHIIPETTHCFMIDRVANTRNRPHDFYQELDLRAHRRKNKLYALRWFVPSRRSMYGPR